MNKTCNVCFDKHAYCHAPKETFSLVHWTQLSGKLSRLKSEHLRNNSHASRLNANGSRYCSFAITNFTLLARYISSLSQCNSNLVHHIFIINSKITNFTAVLRLAHAETFYDVPDSFVIKNITSLNKRYIDQPGR